MADFKIHGTGVIRTADGAIIPPDEGNRDWQAYQVWLEAGNNPDPQFSAAELTAQNHAQVLAQVDALELSQARSIREAFLTGDKTRVLALEKQIATLLGRTPVVQ